VTRAPEGRGLAIELVGVGKRYWKLEEQAMLLRSLMPFRKPRRTELWALRDLDLAIEPGETVGVLGRNGAGKTSMLRLLAGVSQPTEGRLRVVGRIAPLISVGVGFHREMSGRENVYVNGMLLGLTKAEIDERFDAIVAFAELADFIDTPVKFYSSGMFMRLGFSVAIHVDPQVLLVDEILAVGDIAFQLKCFERMRQIQRAGTTIVIVSHSMHAIRLLCPRSVLMRRGRIEFDGPTEPAIARHHELLTLDANPDAGSEPAPVGAVRVLDRQLLGPSGPTTSMDQHTPMRFSARLRFEAAVESPQVWFQVFAQDATLVYEMKTVIGRPYRRFDAGEETEVAVDFIPRLGGGTYRLALAVTTVDGRSTLHADHEGMLVYIAPPLGSAGLADLEASVALDGRCLTDHESMLLNDGPRGNGKDTSGDRAGELGG
jgi:lipopolysaccharide transport system ATP-binding protein